MWRSVNNIKGSCNGLEWNFWPSDQKLDEKQGKRILGEYVLSVNIAMNSLFYFLHAIEFNTFFHIELRSLLILWNGKFSD